MAITVLELALALGVEQSEDGTISGSEFDRVGLPIMGGCQICSASIAAYNSCPTKTGYLQCTDCVETTGQGFADKEELDTWELEHQVDDEGDTGDGEWEGGEQERINDYMASKRYSN